STMPPRGFKCTVEVSIESVASPGAWLPNRDPLYLTVEMFGQAKRTRLVDPAFPLCLHERFVFEKLFWPAADPQDVLEMLDELPVTVELRQVTDVYLGGCLLAYFDAGARDFLYPAGGTAAALASGCAVHRGSRQAQLIRTVDFLGPGPRFEFSTRAVIEQTNLTTGDFDSDLLGVDSDGLDDEYYDDDDDLDATVTPTRRLRRRRLRRARPGYSRQTLSAVMRCRSPGRYASAAAAAALRASGDDLEAEERRLRRRRSKPPQAAATLAAPVRVDGRPPFVVRHVDKNLVSRKPVLHDTLTRLGGPRAPVRPPAASSSLRRSRSSSDLRRSMPAGPGPYGGAGAGRDYGDEFDEDLGTYRAPSAYVSGREDRHGGSPLRHRLYDAYFRRGTDDYDFGLDGDRDYEDFEYGFGGLERGMRRVRIRDGY
ncbi:hypothetical protein BOX15_Mlig017795g1, partial [Macrostomum lignano]